MTDVLGTKIMAHRGASAAATGNTLAAFRLARELGADWVELDVRRTVDGVVIVHHDAHLGDGRLLAEMSSDDLPEYVPSLAEALEECHGMAVNIEIKNLPHDPDYDADHMVADAVAGLVQAYLGPERALVSSFNMQSVDRLLQVDPTIPCGWVYNMIEPATAVARAVAHNMVAIHPYEGLVDANLIGRAHDAGLEVNCWTVDDPDRINRLLDLGIDGICTNVPDVVKKILDQRLS